MDLAKMYVSVSGIASEFAVLPKGGAHVAHIDLQKPALDLFSQDHGSDLSFVSIVFSIDDLSSFMQFEVHHGSKPGGFAPSFHVAGTVAETSLQPFLEEGNVGLRFRLSALQKFSMRVESYPRTEKNDEEDGGFGRCDLTLTTEVADRLRTQFLMFQQRIRED